VKKAVAIVLAVVAGLIGLAALLVVTVVILVQTGALNGVIEDAIAAQVGRPVRLEQAPSLGFEDGALTASIGPLSVANADWAAEQHPDLARIEQARASLRLAPLLSGEVELPEIVIDAPQIHLARNADGVANWPENQDDGTSDGGDVWLPEIANVEIRNADITYSDQVAGADVQLTLDEAKGQLGSQQKLALQASGSMEGEPLELDAAGGSLAALLDAQGAAEPVQVDATVGESTINVQATSLANLDALQAQVEIDARQTLLDLLASLGIATDDLPPFEAAARIEPGETGSVVTAAVAIEDATIQIDGTVDDLAAPLAGFAAKLSARGNDLGAVLDIGGIEIKDDLPDYQLSARVSGSDGSYAIEDLDARLGENTVVGQAAVQDLETLAGLEVKLEVDAPNLGPILTSFEVPYAEQVPSADIVVDVARAKDGTTAAVNGTVGGDRIALEGGYDGAITAFENPRLDLQMEGSNLGALPAKLGITQRPIESYRVAAQIEQRANGPSPVTLDATIEGATFHLDGTVDDLTAPLKGFAAEVSARGDQPGALLSLAGVETEGTLPGYQLDAAVAGGSGGYRIEGLDARLGDNTVTGQAAVDDLETLRGLEVTLDADAPDLGPILASLKLPYAEQIPSAELTVDVSHAEDGTVAEINGTIGDDSIALKGGYEGALTAFENVHLDLQMEGSTLGAVPAQLGLVSRPIESYRIAAQIEERSGEASSVAVDATIEETRAQFDGTVDELRTLQGVDGQFQVQGPDPAMMLNLFELPAVSVPPYDFAGHVTWRGDDIEVTDLAGTFSESDLSGSIAVDLRPAPPALTADLASDRLFMDDVAGVIGAPLTAEERAAEREEGRLLPTGEIDPENWRNLDLDVRYEAAEIRSDYLPIDWIEAHVVSKGGWLTIDPVRTGLADGSILLFASLDGTQRPVAGNLDLRLNNLQLQDMLTKLGLEGEGLGTIDGRVRLEGKGRSIDELLGTADGQTVLTMTGGSIDGLILEAIGLDVAEALAVLFDSSDQKDTDTVPIRCAIVNLEIDGGIATTRPVIIDTEDSKIVVDGTINLEQETLDIFIEAKPKDPSLLSANQPIHIDGNLASPSINPAPGKVENEALGWLLAPLAAVAPFFDLGTEEDSPCASLLAEAKEQAAAKPE